MAQYDFYQDDRVIIERASNNLRPPAFRTIEIEPLTALYRRKRMKHIADNYLYKLGEQNETQNQ